MSLVVAEQLYIFGWAIIYGIIVGVSYDFIRIMRRIIPHKRTLINLEDLFFWILTSIIVFQYIFTFNNGNIRFYIFLGLGIGCIIYYLTLSNIIISSITFILRPFFSLMNYFHKKAKKYLKKLGEWLIIRIRKYLKKK